MSEHQTFFTIITPTYKRKETLLRAIDSVLKQSYQHFSMIIVNDSPEDMSYETIESLIASDPRIIYLKNERNSGVNFSRNRGLDIAKNDSWVIFLDDDDYLHPDTLLNAQKLIASHPKESWFVLNRATSTGVPITRIDKEGHHDTYATSFLIAKRYRGDATHIIKKNVLNRIYFPKTIRQGDEWLFYYQLSRSVGFFYKNWNATITDGYASSGLNFRRRGIFEQLHTVRLLAHEGMLRGLWRYPTFIIYIAIRVIRSFIKK